VAGPDGNLWFAELEGYGYLARITPDGTVSECPIGHYANAITVGPDGNFWYVDVLGNSVGYVGILK